MKLFDLLQSIVAILKDAQIDPSLACGPIQIGSRVLLIGLHVLQQVPCFPLGKNCLRFILYTSGPRPGTSNFSKKSSLFLMDMAFKDHNLNVSFLFKNYLPGASLVAQWLRICLLMQGTRVRALVWEDPTCHGAAGPVSHNY